MPKRLLHRSTKTRDERNQRTWRNILHLIWKRNQDKVNSFKLRNVLSDKCNQKVEKLTTDNKNGFSFKVKPILQLNLLSDIKKFENFSCEINFHKYLNQTKGIIYIQNYKFKEELKKNLN